MLKIIEAIFSLISLIILTSAWVFLVSLISFYIKRMLKIRNGALLAYSILLGTALEILLALVSVFFMWSLSAYNHSLDPGVLSGLENGGNMAALLSPISSIVGAAIGAKKNMPPGRYF